MKKLFLSVLLCSFGIINFAQTDSTQGKVHEIGLTTSTLNTFGLTYRFGTEKLLFRINSIRISGARLQDEDGSPEESWLVSLGVAPGLEMRKAIHSKLDARIGFELPCLLYTSPSPRDA